MKFIRNYCTDHALVNINTRTTRKSGQNDQFVTFLTNFNCRFLSTFNLLNFIQFLNLLPNSSNCLYLVEIIVTRKIKVFVKTRDKSSWKARIDKWTWQKIARLDGERNRRWFFATFRENAWRGPNRPSVRAINPRIPVCGNPARLTGRCDSKLQWEFDGGFTVAYLAARNTNRAAYDAPNNNILSRNFWYLLYRSVKLSRWSVKAIECWRVS